MQIIILIIFLKLEYEGFGTIRFLLKRIQGFHVIVDAKQRRTQSKLNRISDRSKIQFEPQCDG